MTASVTSCWEVVIVDPATAEEAVMFASQAIAHFGRAAQPLESYARCLTRGIIEPDVPRTYLSITEDVDRIRSGNAMPTTSFEAALLVARIWSSAGADTARPFFRMYADRCWSIPSRRRRPAETARSASTAEIVQGTISERGSRRYRYRVELEERRTSNRLRVVGVRRLQRTGNRCIPTGLHGRHHLANRGAVCTGTTERNQSHGARTTA